MAAKGINLRPLADRVIVEPIEQEEVTATGLYIPETAKEKPQQGNVLAAGPGRTDDNGKNIKLDVKVGDKVLFAKYAGTEVKIDGRKLLIMKEADILAVLD
ncbi:MAG: co-chaperone GroES [Anaerolineae bacterium]|nr:co-chaperone GroES [Anaerolineae bacterium]MBN8618040.1 co-chaperone GroES [Anaerolineae bacterium]